MFFHANGNNEKAQSDENVDSVRQNSRSYECSACGEHFESTERLRQHEVDCRDDRFDEFDSEF
jgi:predicted SprT family Zn-dependent metalloprotease